MAILLVVVSHYTGPAYIRFLPYGDNFAWFPGSRSGGVGVQLFFLISGFVILMTLRKCKSMSDFLWRRWLRLFPAMLLASAVLLIASRFLQMPNGQPAVRDALPGLTFIHPAFYKAVSGIPFRSLDDVFWSLYTEVAFYGIIGVLYFKLGANRALIGLGGIWLLALATADVTWTRAFEPFGWLNFGFFGWFLSGALFFRWFESGREWAFASAVALGLVSSWVGLPDGLLLTTHLMMMACTLLFATALRADWLQKALENKPLLFVGAISYPLYLLHNFFGIGVMRSMPLPAPLLPFAALLVCGFIAWIIAAFGEPLLRKGLRRLELRPTPKAADIPA